MCSHPLRLLGDGACPEAPFLPDYRGHHQGGREGRLGQTTAAPRSPWQQRSCRTQRISANHAAKGHVVGMRCLQGLSEQGRILVSFPASGLGGEDNAQLGLVVVTRKWPRNGLCLALLCAMHLFRSQNLEDRDMFCPFPNDPPSQFHGFKGV